MCARTRSGVRRLLPILACALLIPGVALSAPQDGPDKDDPPAAAAPARTDTTSPAPAGAPPQQIGFAEALSSGKTAVNLRYRYEIVDQTGFDLTGYASTLRTTLSYNTKPFRGFSIGLQAENITDIGAADLHNNIGAGDRGNGVGDRPVIADPPGTAMLQAYGQYQAGETLIRLGRQEVIYDDARFVGNVGFRQHHQSFRALRLSNESLDNFAANYSYVDRVYRITGARWDTAHHLINASYRLSDVGTLTGYGYLLRHDEGGPRALDTDTVGGELEGRRALGESGHIRYELEYAHQSNAGNNPGRVSQDYLHLMAGGGYRDFVVRIGWEKLGGSKANGRFQTPLATLHAFNGWADKFLATPVNGLKDLYARADGPAGPLRWVVVYHWFRAATGDTKYGTELDFQITYQAPWRQSFGFRGASYKADGFSTDTTKLWIYSTYSF